MKSDNSCVQIASIPNCIECRNSDTQCSKCDNTKYLATNKTSCVDDCANDNSVPGIKCYDASRNCINAKTSDLHCKLTNGQCQDVTTLNGCEECASATECTVCVTGTCLKGDKTCLNPT